MYLNFNFLDPNIYFGRQFRVRNVKGTAWDIISIDIIVVTITIRLKNILNGKVSFCAIESSN